MPCSGLPLPGYQPAASGPAAQWALSGSLPVAAGPPAAGLTTVTGATTPVCTALSTARTKPKLGLGLSSTELKQPARATQ
jgi:hypothetical protein